MKKQPNNGWWLPFLSKWGIALTLGVAFSCISIWSGLGLRGFFRNSPSPKRPDSATSCPLERPAEKETLPEPEEQPEMEPAEEFTSAALRGDTAGIDTIENDEKADGELEGGTFPALRGVADETRESDSSSEIGQSDPFTQKLREILQNKIAQRAEAITRSLKRTAYLNQFFDYVQKIHGYSDEAVRNHPHYATLAMEITLRNRDSEAILFFQNEIRKLDTEVATLEAPSTARTLSCPLDSGSEKDSEMDSASLVDGSETRNPIPGYLTLSQRSSSALSLLTGFDTDTSTEVSKLEALEQMDEKWILTKAITCPRRLRERKLRRAREPLRPFYSSRNPRKNPPRIRKTDSYDSRSLQSPIRRSIMSKEFPDSSDSGSL